MPKLIIRKILIIYFAIIAAIVLLQVAHHVRISIDGVNKHQQVLEILGTDYKVAWQDIDQQLNEINTLTHSRSITPEDAGMLHERAALFYFNKGDTVNYFQNMGYALYYLKQGNDKDHTINVYLDLANFFLNNYSEKEATEMFTYAQNVRPFDEIEDIQVKSYAYRMLGIMSILNLEYNEAETYFIKSISLLESSNTGVFEEEYIAMSEIWLARVYEETGRLPKCKEILDKYQDNYMFTSDIYQNVFLRDFVIPYYQAKCYYLCAENIKERSNSTEAEKEARATAVINYVHEFMALCEREHYEKAELYTLRKIHREYPTRNEKIQKELDQVVSELYANIYEQQNSTYAAVIDTIVQNSLTELKVRDTDYDRDVKRIRFLVFILIGISLLVLTALLLLINNRLDGMTGLLNRKAFDSKIKRVIRSSSDYGVIMIDIDNFKSINDTYGHLSGDIVIRRLGIIISKETNSFIRGYRYGGEEFALIINKTDLPYIKKIADRIRNYTAQQGWEFNEDLVITISEGAAIGNGTGVVKQADDNLYISKQTGKNKLTFSKTTKE